MALNGLPTSARIAEMVGVTGSFVLVGTFQTLSLATVPVLLESASKTAASPETASAASSTLLSQWRGIYVPGKARGPVIATVASLCYAYAAYSSSRVGEDWRALSVAAAATWGILPYTWMTMIGVNKKLMDAATGKMEGMMFEEARALVSRWGTLNLIRGIFPLAGGLAALWKLAM